MIVIVAAALPTVVTVLLTFAAQAPTPHPTQPEEPVTSPIRNSGGN